MLFIILLLLTNQKRLTSTLAISLLHQNQPLQLDFEILSIVFKVRLANKSIHRTYRQIPAQTLTWIVIVKEVEDDFLESEFL